MTLSTQLSLDSLIEKEFGLSVNKVVNNATSQKHMDHGCNLQSEKIEEMKSLNVDANLGRKEAFAVMYDHEAPFDPKIELLLRKYKLSKEERRVKLMEEMRKVYGRKR